MAEDSERKRKRQIDREEELKAEIERERKVDESSD